MVSTLMAFPQFTEVSTLGEGKPSDDLHYWAGIGKFPSGGWELIVVDLQTTAVLATKPVDKGSLDWVSMSPQGAFVVVMATDGSGTRVYDRTLMQGRKVLDDYTHGDLGLDGAGEEVLTYVAVSSAQLTTLGCPHAGSGMSFGSVRLRDGKQTLILGDCWSATWQQKVVGSQVPWTYAVHFSAVASRAYPGWVLVSTTNTPQDPHEVFSREVLWLKADGSGQVSRLAHHHSDEGVLTNGDKDYWSEPHATSSWDGRHVFFASVWETPGEHYDLYVIAAPPPASADTSGRRPRTRGRARR
jgi:hypothetical protein